MAKNVFNVDVASAEIDPAAVVGTQYLDFEDRLKKLAEIIDAQRAKIKALKDELKAETRTLETFQKELEAAAGIGHVYAGATPLFEGQEENGGDEF